MNIVCFVVVDFILNCIIYLLLFADIDIFVWNYIYIYYFAQEIKWLLLCYERPVACVLLIYMIQQWN